MCCILYDFLIEEKDIGKNEQDKEFNSKALLKFEYISEDKRRSKNIAKQQGDMIFNKLIKEKYKIERRKLDRKNKK
jgi:hypothetical protein